MTFLSLSPTSNSLIFTWNTSLSSRPSGNPKELLSIAAATHTFCHRSGTKGSRNNTFSSDLAASSEIATPNKPSDPSFHQVLQIYLLSKSVPSPISVDYTSEQVDASTIKTSRSSSNNIHPSLHFFYPIYHPPKNTAFTSFKNFFRFQSAHFDCCILFIWILTPSYQFTIHSFHTILLYLSLASFWHHASNIYSSFLKPCFKAVCQLLFSILSPTCYTYFLPH